MRCHLTENCARRCSWCRWSVWLESASVVGSPEARRRGWRLSGQCTYALRFFSSSCWSMMGIESPLLCFLDVRQRPGFVEDRPSLLAALQLILSRKSYIATVEMDSQTGDRLKSPFVPSRQCTH